MYKPTECYLSVKLDVETISALLLETTAESIRKAILGAPKLKLKEKHVQVVKPYKLKINPIDTGRDTLFYSLQQVRFPSFTISRLSYLVLACLTYHSRLRTHFHASLCRASRQWSAL